MSSTEKTTADFDYSALAKNTYDKCETYRKLENAYLRGFEYEYSLSDDAVEILEDTIGGQEKLDAACTHLAEGQAFEKEADKARSDHMETCDICRPYWEALQVSRKELENKQ